MTTLPSRPYEVYRDATFLVVEDWDRGRDITRKSKYGHFNTRKKLEFLYELSFELTYKKDVKVFNFYELRSVYQNIHSKYNFAYFRNERSYKRN